MDKYIGNKRVLLETIEGFISERCAGATTFCDVFAGTTNVGRYFRNRGYRVISNDINRFSYVLGTTYLDMREYPAFDKLPSLRPPPDQILHLKSLFDAAARRDRAQLFPLDRAEAIWRELAPAARVLAYLNTAALPARPRCERIRDYFTAFGSRSDFTSVRGSTGKRNYFSLENARRIDWVLNTIRGWWESDRLTESELHFLMTSVLEEVVIVANVNGTFHDFNRDRLWPNSLQEFTLKVPLVSARANGATASCCSAGGAGRMAPAPGRRPAAGSSTANRSRTAPRASCWRKPA